MQIIIVLVLAVVVLGALFAAFWLHGFKHGGAVGTGIGAEVEALLTRIEALKGFLPQIEAGAKAALGLVEREVPAAGAVAASVAVVAEAIEAATKPAPTA